MKIINETPLSEIKEQRENQESIPFSLSLLGQQLVQEKLDHAQTKEIVNALGQELVHAKLDIADLKGGNA